MDVLKLARIVFISIVPALSPVWADDSRNLPDDLFTAPESVLQSRKQERLQAIQQLQFDRRPSAILKAWSAPETEEAESNDEVLAPDSAPEAPLLVIDEDSGSISVQTMPVTAPMMITRVVGGQTVQAHIASSNITLSPMEEGRATTESPADSAESVSDTSASTAAATKTDGQESSTYSAAYFARQLKDLQRNVTLGNWPAVGAYLETLVSDEAKALYDQMLQSLVQMQAPGGVQPQLPIPPQFLERNTFSNADVIAMANLSPKPLEAANLSNLGRMLAMAMEQGHAIRDFVARAKSESEKPEDKAALSRREAAKILFAAGKNVEAGDFLPGVADAERENDREALNLLSRHFLALYAKDPKAGHLERAWKVNQAVLAVGEVGDQEKTEALRRAVELAPKVDGALGRAWLVESFTDRPERGMEILAAIGEETSRGIQTRPMQADERSKRLALQKQAVDALLGTSPKLAESWAKTLGLLAQVWMVEAEYSRRFDQSSVRGPRMQRDSYGNIYYSPFDASNQAMMMAQNNGMPQAIPVGEILENRPSASWLDQLPGDMIPGLSALFAELLLKVGEEDEAFPHIETLAKNDPEQARQLAEEFVRVWTRNHDPNAAQDYTNPYIFMFGYERRAESIPLTRSKQERNLKELAGWVQKLQSLPIGELDQRLLARAFTASHSVAEVYRIEAIESVFGPVDDLSPDTMAELVQQMRSNLVSVWRSPAVQEQNKTRRREKDIRAEVVRGYEVARTVIDRTLKQHPDHWKLVLAQASVMHDENNYRHEAELSTDFVPARRAALQRFQRAAELYAKALPELDANEQTAEVYEVWYYASLGASDLNQIDPKQVADRGQPALIKAAMDALPDEAAERHRTMFANDLFVRMSSVNPAVKFAYVEGGFEIVGDHPQAYEAKQIYDYYKDLVQEIKLGARLDGPDTVGHDEPFGIFVELYHTREIERESGGFGRYLQNQNTGNLFYYNYGRPLENYRDKFEEVVRKALEEHFEVLSVTFQAEDVNSKADSEYGWRVTPYAYLLVKARGPRVDRVPPVRLDLDFLDTSGYVILPIESPAIPIEAKSEQGGSRPFENLQITQTLDERQAEDGKLVLEVKATARGLVPSLEALLDVTPTGFEVTKVEDQGLSVTQFDAEGEETAVLSERNWLISLQADPGAPNRPEVFQFASSNVDGAETIFQRYVDADLEEVPAEVALEGQYRKSGQQAWLPWVAGFLATGFLACLAWWLWPRTRQESIEGLAIPEPLTPFSVLGLLRHIEQDAGLNSGMRDALTEDIARLERHYFAEGQGAEPDLRTLAQTWVVRVSA